MSDYVLYGSHASFYTARPRAQLRKMAVPFIERLPSAPRFRDHVRPTSGTHRIPQLEAPDGTVVQDSVEISDFLEARFPEAPARPPGPCQQVFAHLLELLGSEGLVLMAWHYRWNFPDENQDFVVMDFGRSFRPQGSDDELRHYGGLIADRMEGYRKGLEASGIRFDRMEPLYHGVLAAWESHLTLHPYAFGGLPSLGDYALMAPLYGHLARDPLPAFQMRQRAPRVSRWVEHMNTPEIVSPEFAEVPPAYLLDDAVPETLLALLRVIADSYAETLLDAAAVWNAWVDAHPERQPGDPVSDEGHDQPTLTRTLPGRDTPVRANAHILWVLQRSLDAYAALPPAARERCDALAEPAGVARLLEIRLARPLCRVDNRLAVGPAPS